MIQRTMSVAAEKAMRDPDIIGILEASAGQQIRFPKDPNQLAGPVALQPAPTPRHCRASPRLWLAASFFSAELRQASAAYPQPFVYTIQFHNERGPNRGSAETVIVDNAINALLDPGTIQIGLITFETDGKNGGTVLCQTSPRQNGQQSYQLQPIVPGSERAPIKVTFVRAGRQLRWTFSGSLPPGATGSVSFIVFPVKTTGTLPEAIKNDGAAIKFLPADPMHPAPHTNLWP